MRRQVVARPAGPAASRIKNLLTKPFDLAHQGVDLLLLANDDLIELLKQVFSEAGLDFQLGQPAVDGVVGLGRVHALIGHELAPDQPLRWRGLEVAGAKTRRPIIFSLPESFDMPALSQPTARSRIATITAALCLAAPMAQAQEAQTVKIAHAGPTSGGIAHIGKDTENGVRLAIDELNTQNLVIGGKKIKFELVAEDDAGDPRQATAVAQKLCDAEVAGVIGHLQSGTSIPAATVYNRCGLPNITASATNPDLAKPGYKTTFRLIANDNALGAALAIFAGDALKVRKVAVIDDRTAYGQGLADVFKATARQKGIEVVSEEFTTDKATDFMAILTGIKSKKPDAIFFGGLDAQAGPMLRQMQQLGLSDVKFFGGDALCTEKLPDLSSQAGTVKNVTCATGGASIQPLAVFT